MTTGIIGRKVRIKYDEDGAGAGTPVELARAKTESFKGSADFPDITTKDDSGIQTLLNDVGSRSFEMSFSCVLAAAEQHKTLIGLMVSAAAGTSLHWFEFVMEGVGTFRGQWAITSLDLGGEEGANAGTFEMSVKSSGVISWTAAA